MPPGTGAAPAGSGEVPPALEAPQPALEARPSPRRVPALLLPPLPARGFLRGHDAPRGLPREAGAHRAVPVLASQRTGPAPAGAIPSHASRGAGLLRGRDHPDPREGRTLHSPRPAGGDR